MREEELFVPLYKKEMRNPSEKYFTELYFPTMLSNTAYEICIYLHLTGTLASYNRKDRNNNILLKIEIYTISHI